MASPITIGGVQVLAADQGDTFAWGAAIKAALAQVAATCLQTTGGSFPLAADLNLGNNFGIVGAYFTSAAPNPATGGVIRLPAVASIDFRNQANSNDNFLGTGVGFGKTGTVSDDLWWRNSGVLGQIDTLITGQPGFHARRATSDQTGITTNTVLLFNSVLLDTDSAYNPATGIWTCPANKGGTYLFTWSAAFTQGGGVAGQVQAAMQGTMFGGTFPSAGMNGTTTPNGTNCYMSGAVIMPCNPGDTMKMLGSTSAGSMSLLNSTTCNFAAKRMV